MNSEWRQTLGTGVITENSTADLWEFSARLSANNNNYFLTLGIMCNERITKAWKVLREHGWSDLIATKHKNEVIATLKEGVAGITDEEINNILEVCLW
jgi:hypothetical protein